MELCACGSALAYAECCRPVIKGERRAETAEALMRARYAAYVNVETDFIFESTHPKHREGYDAEIDRLRMRMEKELAQESPEAVNPKLGHGGLVDVEFAVQFLQLAHGRDHPSIRAGSTPRALALLRAEGLLREAEYEPLARGYEFLRRVELRLRIVHDYAIDHLPEGGPALHQLARRLGYDGAEPGARFLLEYGRVTAAVRKAFDEVVR